MKQERWFWGTFFLLAAIFVIGSQVTDFVQIGFWSILGTILLVSIMIQSIFHRNFFGILIPIAFLYKMFCQPVGWVNISIWILLAAAILASMGFSYIFRSGPSKTYHKYHKNWNEKDYYKHLGKEGCLHQTTENTDDNNPYAKVDFGSSTRYLHSTALKTGQFYCSFGSLEIYFDQATLDPNGAEIYVDCSFGTIELYVPREWEVIGNVHATLGSADIDKRSFNTDAKAPTLTIAGNVSFGSVEVNYV